MIRRYVNMVAANYSSCKYSLHRLDVAKHLFHPSTAHAEAANEKEANNNGGWPSKIGTLQQLPPVSMCFEVFPYQVNKRMWTPNNNFALVSPRSSDSRIIRISNKGDAIVYDVISRSTVTIPCFEGPLAIKRTIIPIACAGMKQDKVYVINAQYGYRSFKVLDFNEHPHQWQDLPAFPFPEDYVNHSSTLLDDGATICVLDKSNGTYCFDTRSLKWWQAGDWYIPFNGRAEHVPELGAWFGFSPFRRIFLSHGHQLCASSDLSRMDAHPAPTLQHVWEYLRPLEEEEKIALGQRFLNAVVTRRVEWEELDRQLLNLGGGRFCIANRFQETQSVSHTQFEHLDDFGEEFLVLTGVEVLRSSGGDGEARLRMVKHKSLQYMSNNEQIESVL